MTGTERGIHGALGSVDGRQLVHVALADFRQRTRSRRLLVVLGAVALLGYWVNVGQVGLAYQFSHDGESVAVGGEPTAAFVGLEAGMAGAAFLAFVGFYVAKGSLGRDRIHDVADLVASTPVDDRTYLLGKWVSNVALCSVLVATLAVATVANHAVHGVGPTDPVALVVPIAVLALPVGAFVGALALLFETVDWLDGTLGNVAYFFGLTTLWAAVIATAVETQPGEVAAWGRAGDLLGHFAVYELTADAVATATPGYDGGLPSFGTIDAQEVASFRWEGGTWPWWIFAQRLGMVLVGLGIALGASTVYDRRPSTGDAEEPSDGRTGLGARVERVLAPTRAVLRRETDAETTPTPEPNAFDPTATTPVTDRGAGGFRRLVVAELRLAVRGHSWWWYAGAAALVVAPLAGLAAAGSTDATTPIRRFALPMAFVWPIAVWSPLGRRTHRHGLTDLVLSSQYALHQVLAQWLAGVCIGLGIASGLVVTFVAAGQGWPLLGVTAGVLFAPSLALALGSWSRSPWPFEIGYLLVWYVGPLNAAGPIDFLAATDAGVAWKAPVAFLAASVPLVAAALIRRRMEVG